MASGPVESLAQLRRIVSRGPDGARVDLVTDLEPVTEPLDFPFAMRR